MQMIRCPRCDKENPEEAMNCRRCGIELYDFLDKIDAAPPKPEPAPTPVLAYASPRKPAPPPPAKKKSGGNFLWIIAIVALMISTFNRSSRKSSAPARPTYTNPGLPQPYGPSAPTPDPFNIHQSAPASPFPSGGASSVDP